MINTIKKYWWIFVILIVVVAVVYFKFKSSFFGNIFRDSAVKKLDIEEKEINEKIDKLKTKSEDYTEEIKILEEDIDTIKKEKENINSKKFDNGEDAYKYIKDMI